MRVDQARRHPVPSATSQGHQSTTHCRGLAHEEEKDVPPDLQDSEGSEKKTVTEDDADHRFKDWKYAFPADPFDKGEEEPPWAKALVAAAEKMLDNFTETYTNFDD